MLYTRLQKKNKIHLKNNARTKYKENIVLEVRERFEKGEDFYKIAREMHLNPNSVKNILEKKIRTLKINEDLEYLKKYLSKYDVVTLVKFQNKLRRNIFIFEDTLSKVGLKIFMTKTVVKMIDLLTPEYYCDFWV